MVFSRFVFQLNIRVLSEVISIVEEVSLYPETVRCPAKLSFSLILTIWNMALVMTLSLKIFLEATSTFLFSTETVVSTLISVVDPKVTCLLVNLLLVLIIRGSVIAINVLSFNVTSLIYVVWLEAPTFLTVQTSM